MLTLAGCATLPPRQSADVILLNGQVMTPSGWAEAVAVEGDRIAFVGSSEDARRRQGPRTRVVDLDGKAVLPGLFDMHVHPLLAGTELARCRIAQGADGPTLVATLARCVESRRPGEWIAGGQWDASALGGTPLHRETLDKVSPNNPVVLYDTSAHSNWANSVALRLAGIDRNTPDPPGGIIERDRNGEPTGILREAAGALVRSKLPAPTAAENEAALSNALSILTSYGVTSLTDAMVMPETLAAYASLADQGRLQPRVRGCLVESRAWAPEGAFETMMATRNRYRRDRLNPDCVKLFIDGVPIDSRTAAMLEPYQPGPGGRVRPLGRGMLLIQPPQLEEMVTRFDKSGLTVKFHAVGDWAGRVSLDAIAAARRANGDSGPAHDVGHLTFMHPQDLARATGLRATLEYSPYLWFPAPIVDDIIKVVGPPRIDRAWPVKEGLRSGALVVAGSDWSVVPSANPWIGIETLVTRRKPGEPSGTPFAPDEAISLADAIAIFTINGARQMGMGAQLGSIETGKLADLIVLDRNPFRIPITEVHRLRTVMSFVGGRQAYDGVAPGEVQ